MMSVPESERVGRAPGRVAGTAAVTLVLLLAACGGGSNEISVDSSGPLSGVSVSQMNGELVVRWEQTADSPSCRLDYALASGESGSRSFGAISAVPIVEEVFDVPGEVVSASLTCL
jgi:hypothetical protein